MTCNIPVFWFFCNHFLWRRLIIVDHVIQNSYNARREMFLYISTHVVVLEMSPCSNMLIASTCIS